LKLGVVHSVNPVLVLGFCNLRPAALGTPKNIIVLPGPDTVSISKKRYESLKEDADRLGCLECAGVDNWSGYGECFDADCEGYIATCRREDQ